jgi:23S rRNA-/tRNA-specific pseudouridylate synthase
MKTIRISFAVTTHYDSIFEVDEKTISKLKQMLNDNETLEISENSEPELHKMIIESCTTESFDFVYQDEDIEIVDSERMIDYPIGSKRKPL